jgi:Zn-dependent protease
LLNFLPSPPELISYLIILLTAFPVHEFAHAWVADRFGDTTPRANGRLTLNPLAHLDPIGSLLMIVVGFGWAKPVPINPYVLQKSSRAAPMLVSLAGPLSNLLMAIFGSAFFRVGLISFNQRGYIAGGILPNAALFMSLFVGINLFLMLFNLIPLFPLDGEKVLDYFLPPAGVRFMESIRPYAPMILLVIVIVLPMVGIDLLGRVIQPAFNFLTHLLIGG